LGRQKKKHRQRKGFNFATRITCKVKDGYKCQMPFCENEDNLEAHHVIKRQVCLEKYNWSKYKTNNIRNAITICRDCHRRLHTDNLWKVYILEFQHIIANRE